MINLHIERIILVFVACLQTTIAHAQSPSQILVVEQCAYSHIQDYAFNHPSENIPLPQTEGQIQSLNTWARQDLSFENADNAYLDVFRQYIGTMRALNGLGR